jgi:hypothetical protein
MPIYSPTGFLDVTNATLRGSKIVTTSNVGIANLDPLNTLSVGSNLQVEDTGSNVLTVRGNAAAAAMTLGVITIAPSYSLEIVSNIGNTVSNTVQFTNATTGFVSASNIEVGTGNLFVDTTTGEVTVGEQLTVNNRADITDLHASNLTVDSALYANAATGRVGVNTTSPGDFALDVHGTANVGALTATDVIVTGNLAVSGDIAAVRSTTVNVDDPIIGLANNNTSDPAVLDIGFVMARPSTAEGSNVAIIFDESSDTLEIGYTQSKHTDTTITMDDGTLFNTNIHGNVSVSNLNVGQFSVVAAYGLDHVTNENNSTGDTIISTNATTGLQTTANVVVGQDALVSGNVGVGTTNPGALLELSKATGSATISPTELRLSTRTNAADWSVTDPWARLAFYTNDVTGDAPGVMASVGAVASSVDGGENTRLAFFTAEPHVERMCVDRYGNVGIGTTSPDSNLHVYGSSSQTNIYLGEDGTTDKAGIIKYFQGNGTGTGTLHLGHWGDSFSSTQTLCIQKGGNVGIGTASPDYPLHVVGNLGIDGDIFTKNWGYRSADGSTTNLYIGRFARSRPVNIEINTSGSSVGSTSTFEVLRHYNAHPVVSGNAGEAFARYQWYYQSVDTSDYDLWVRPIHSNSGNYDIRALSSGYQVVTEPGSPTLVSCVYGVITCGKYNENSLTGIGTASPSAPFHVQGARSILGNNGGASDIVINDAPTARWKISTGGYALHFSKHNSSSDEYSTWSEKVRIDQNGNVGIGAASPTHLLDLYKNSTNGASIKLESSGGYASTIGQKSYASSDRALQFTNAPYAGSNPAFTFLTLNSAGTGYNNLFTITGEGNVGIGTNTFTDTRNTGGLHLPNSKGISFAASANSGSRHWRIRTDDFSDHGTLQIGVSDNNTTHPDAADEAVMTMNRNRNVGIGTASPVHLLDVNGIGWVRGNLHVGEFDASDWPYHVKRFTSGVNVATLSLDFALNFMYRGGIVKAWLTSGVSGQATVATWSRKVAAFSWRSTSNLAQTTIEDEEQHSGNSITISMPSNGTLRVTGTMYSSFSYPMMEVEVTYAGGVRGG